MGVLEEGGREMGWPEGRVGSGTTWEVCEGRAAGESRCRRLGAEQKWQWRCLAERQQRDPAMGGRVLD